VFVCRLVYIALDDDDDNAGIMGKFVMHPHILQHHHCNKQQQQQQQQ
jgi:hypothetical protein